jgi:hypothetical protein
VTVIKKPTARGISFDFSRDGNDTSLTYSGVTRYKPFFTCPNFQISGSAEFDRGGAVYAISIRGVLSTTTVFIKKVEIYTQLPIDEMDPESQTSYQLLTSTTYLGPDEYSSDELTGEIFLLFSPLLGGPEFDVIVYTTNRECNRTQRIIFEPSEDGGGEPPPD